MARTDCLSLQCNKSQLPIMIKKDEDYQRSYMTEENVTQTQIVWLGLLTTGVSPVVGSLTIMVPAV